MILNQDVLILVLMEDTLWERRMFSKVWLRQVLILVLMEDTLWAIHFINHLIIYSLNPCFNGRYSLSPKYFENEDNVDVLILVLMEDTLWATKGIRKQIFENVLILVLMEDTLWGGMFARMQKLKSLNPCFNGRYSLRLCQSRWW